MKYEIKHPVINDDRMIVWRGCERRSWPSQIVVSPKTQIPILILHGEGQRNMLDIFLSVAYDFYYDALNHKRTFKIIPEEHKQQVEEQQAVMPLSKEIKNARTQNLRYPGKVLAIERQDHLESNLLVISDSANNRVIVINEETMECEATIGNGKVGLVDGSYSEVQFHFP
jgi:hypothetical protein